MQREVRLVWSLPARQDLREIWNYAAETAGPDQADDYVRRIDASCRLLITSPLLGRSRNDLRSGLRSLAVPPHLIFYRVGETSVEVVRVLHGRRDLPPLFGGRTE